PAWSTSCAARSSASTRTSPSAASAAASAIGRTWAPRGARTPTGTGGDGLSRGRQAPHGKAASPVIYGQAMLGIGRSVSGVVVRGIDPAQADAVIDVGRHLKSGSLAELGRPQSITLPADEGGGTVELPGI